MRRSLFFSSVLALGLSGVSLAAEVRTWSDKSGKFKVQAELIEVLKDKVALKKPDGKRVEIPLDKLSDADRKFVESMEEENPFQDAPAAAPENPFQDAAPADGASGGVQLASGDLPPKGKKKGDAWMAPDFVKLRRVPALKKTDKNNWQLPIIPAAAELAESVQLPKLTFHERVNGSVVSPNGQWLAISTNEPWQGGRVLLVNLKEGVLVASMETGKPKDHKASRPTVLAVSPDGKYLLTGLEANSWNREEAMQTTLWQVAGEEFQPAMIWAPFDTGSKEWVDQDRSRTTWAGFADEKSLLLQANGFVVKWDLTTGKPTYQSGLNAQSIKFTADGSKILAASNAALGVVDVALGKILYYKNINASGMFDISPDGKRILIHNGDTIEILDAATGDTEKSIRVEQGGPSYWAGNDHILAGEHALLDVENEFVCWNYTGQTATINAGGKLWFLTNDNQISLLRSEDLPHPEALAKIKEAQRDPNFFLLQPGASVNIDVQIPEQAAEIKTALIASLEKAGFKYSPDAPMTFVCSKKAEKQEEVTIRDFGSFGGGEKISFTPKSVFLELKEDGSGGKTLWSRMRRGWVPPIFNLKDGETTAAAVRRYEDPGAAFFSQVTFPKFIVRPGKAGETVLSASGFGG